MATYIVSPSDFIGRRVRSDVTPGVSFVVKVTISMVNVIATSITISIVIVIIMITRPKPAYGRQGLAAVSLRASGAQLGRGK